MKITRGRSRGSVAVRRFASILLLVGLAACQRHEQANPSADLAAKQAQVAQRGRAVMPFDIDRTMHHFTKTPEGGVQQVLSLDGDPHEVALVRAHLRREAAQFGRGDFSDPVLVHGAGMPGVQELSAGAHRLRIVYSDVPRGGEIRYASDDKALVAAIHRWFDVQVREHGHHAMAS
jgi:hypothetical protein